MKTQVSRRFFLGRSLLGSAALAAGACSATRSRPRAPGPGTPEDVTRALTPRLLGTQPGVARLARNENPYGPSQRVYAAVEAATRLGAYYPDRSYLEGMIAEKNRLRPEQVALSSGSEEFLAAAAVAWGQSGALVAARLCFEDPIVFAESKGVPVRRVPLTSDLSVDLAAMEAAVTADVSLVHICNPNNPTGRLLDGDALRSFCRRVSPRATVLIDEAYNELTDDPTYSSMLDLVREGLNVIVARTFSKIYGMAGLRIGYLMSTPENLTRAEQYRCSIMAGPSLAAAIAAYDDEQFLVYSKTKLIEGREKVIAATKGLGLEHLPSQTNFLFVNVRRSAEEIRARMQERGILIRGIYGDYTTWSRVSIGLLEDVDRYVKALPEVLKA